MSRLDAADPVPETPLEVDTEALKNEAGRAMRIAVQIMELASGKKTVERMQKAQKAVDQLVRLIPNLQEKMSEISREIPKTSDELPELPSVPPGPDQGVFREKEE